MHKNKPELHVEMKSAAPGLTKVLQTFPEAARPMIELIDIVLRTMDSPLSMGQRELLFTAASWNNGCVTDAGVHSQLVGLLMDDGQDLVEVVRTQGPCAIAGFDPKMHELIHLAVDVTKMVGLQLSEHMSTLAIGS